MKRWHENTFESRGAQGCVWIAVPIVEEIAPAHRFSGSLRTVLTSIAVFDFPDGVYGDMDFAGGNRLSGFPSYSALSARAGCGVIQTVVKNWIAGVVIVLGLMPIINLASAFRYHPDLRIYAYCSNGIRTAPAIRSGRLARGIVGCCLLFEDIEGYQSVFV